MSLAALTDKAVEAMYNTGTLEQRRAARAELFKRAIPPLPKRRAAPEPTYAKRGWSREDWQERQWA